MRKELSQLIKEVYNFGGKKGFVAGFKLEEVEGYWWAGVYFNGKDYSTSNSNWGKIGPNIPEKAVKMLLKELKEGNGKKDSF